MAKLARNRGMFFGSWTGKSTTATAKVDIGDSTGITAATVDATKFAEIYGVSGEYTFIYDGTSWIDNLTHLAEADLVGASKAVTVTGEAAENDILVVTYSAASGGWEALGKDNDDLSKELNPDTETSKNVLGEATFKHSGYEPEIDMDPYYIDPSRVMYQHLLDVALEETYDEANLLGYFAEAYFTAANKQTRKMTGYCYVRRAWYVPQSVGGDTTAYAIPVKIAPVGAVTKCSIEYDMATNEATIDYSVT